jgi:6-phosphogluconate dehydrogenase
VPSTLIPAALFARYSSFYKDDRVQLNNLYGDANTSTLNLDTNDILKAYQFARIMNHFQGFNLISEASKKHEWDLNLSEIARIWTNGCIIKSSLMIELVEILKETSNILMDKKIIEQIKDLKSAINIVVLQCVLNELSTPCLSESVQFFNGYISQNSPANIIQAQRDYFGAHTYQRIDDPSEKFYHTNWD